MKKSTRGQWCGIFPVWNTPRRKCRNGVPGIGEVVAGTMMQTHNMIKKFRTGSLLIEENERNTSNVPECTGKTVSRFCGWCTRQPKSAKHSISHSEFLYFFISGY